MADRRMFAKTIIDSDAFLDMPLSTQALYFHLSMRADDEGFINNPKRIQRTIGASDDDMKVLLAKNFIISFETGVIVIKHWKIHNYIRGDRLRKTAYKEERSMLEIKDNGAYTLNSELNDFDDMSVTCQSNVSIGKVSIGKDSIDKVSIGKDNIYGVKSTRFVPPTVDEIKEYCLERNNNVDAEKFYDFYQAKGWMVGKNKMKDWKACVRTWENRDKKPSNQQPTRDIFKELRDC
jgi:hypothetical protein